MYERGSITLFRYRGVPVRAHWSLLLVVPYLALVLATQFREVARLAGVSGAPVLPPMVWGVLLAAGLFASVLAHELAHTVVALRRGGRVRGITLLLLGGVSQITRMPGGRGAEALMALAGPATSLLLAFVILALNRLLPGAPADVRMGLFYLGSMNLVLGVFNLLPAFPMDGGRILRAILSTRLGPVRATHAAARVGRVLAVLMGLVGLWSGNLLLLLIAVFVYLGAGAENRAERFRAALVGVPVGDLVPTLRGPAPTIVHSARLADVLPRMQELGRTELVVVDPAGSPEAVVGAADLAATPREARHARRLTDVLGGLGARHVAVPGELTATDALEAAAEAGVPYVVVTDETGSVMGLLTAADLDAAVTLRLAEGRRPGFAS